MDNQENGADFAVAAVVYADEGDAAVAALWQAVQDLQAQGVAVAGLLNPIDGAGKHDNSVLHSIADERRYRIFQNLGSGSTGCKLDGGALASAGEVLREAVEHGADLLLINKFGHAEADNRGLLAEYLAAVSAGIPVLTTVHTKYLPDWQRFTGAAGTELPDCAAAVLTWANRVLTKDKT